MPLISFFANIFGYVLNFLYQFIGNFGLSIILFSILAKIVMIPISISQQKNMKKSQKLNEEMKQIQFKYKNDPEKMNQEVMSLYKREKMNPFSGCLSAIVQIILLFAVFFLVRSPLTYMKKVDSNVIEKLENYVQEQGSSSNYKEIAVINYINKVRNNEIKIDNDKNASNGENTENTNEEGNDEKNNVDNNENNHEKININDYLDEAYVNMDFLGLDLSKVPTEDLKDFKVLIIPILYVISSFISIRISTNTTKKSKNDKLLGDGKDQNKEELNQLDPMASANKSMSWFMPLMSISIALIAPLGLALYWLINNILMIIERIILNKYFNNDDKKEEATNNA